MHAVPARFTPRRRAGRRRGLIRAQPPLPHIRHAPAHTEPLRPLAHHALTHTWPSAPRPCCVDPPPPPHPATTDHTHTHAHTHLGLLLQLLGQRQLVLLHQRGAHSQAAGLVEGEDHAAAARGAGHVQGGQNTARLPAVQIRPFGALRHARGRAPRPPVSGGARIGIPRRRGSVSQAGAQTRGALPPICRNPTAAGN